MKVRPLLREAWDNARAARAYSVLFAATAFLVVGVVVVLVGQAEDQRRSLQASFNQPQLRTFEIVDQQNLGVIPWDMAARARSLGGIRQAWALGSAFDVVNSWFPGHGTVSGRRLGGDWAQLPIRLNSGRLPHAVGETIVDLKSAAALGLDRAGGSVQSSSGAQWAVVGIYTPLHPKAPVGALMPASPQGSAHSVVATVIDVSLVSSMSRTVARLSDATAPGQLAVDKSPDAQALGARVASDVGERGSAVVVLVMCISLLILAFLSVLMVHTRRQEFGRRRALGATRLDVVALVVLHGVLVVAAGALIGVSGGAAVDVLRYHFVPPPAFLAVLAATIVAGTAVAQVPSAVVAGLRDPVRVLRTP